MLYRDPALRRSWLQVLGFIDGPPNEQPRPPGAGAATLPRVIEDLGSRS
jgi:hypothetical protein